MFLSLLLGILFLTPPLVSAHQPRIPNSFPVIVDNPEISKAYYAKTSTNPEVYIVSSENTFDLYVNILVPDIPNQSKDLFVNIIKRGTTNEPIAYLDGTKYIWTSFFEPFGHDNYWMGPELKLQAPAGTYEIQVSGNTSDTKYSLAIGEAESFGFAESLKVLSTIPVLKINFFNKSPIDFLLSPIGGGYLAFLILSSFIFGLVFRLTMHKYAKEKIRRKIMNIGTKDRLIRLSLGLAILILAITTNWNGILIFLAGFCIFESMFSWCGIYALMGKNSCPI